MLNTVGAATAVRAALPGLTQHYKDTGVAGSVVLFSSVAVQQVWRPMVRRVADHELCLLIC